MYILVGHLLNELLIEHTNYTATMFILGNHFNAMYFRAYALYVIYQHMVGNRCPLGYVIGQSYFSLKQKRKQAYLAVSFSFSLNNSALVILGKI